MRADDDADTTTLSTHRRWAPLVSAARLEYRGHPPELTARGRYELTGLRGDAALADRVVSDAAKGGVQVTRVQADLGSMTVDAEPRIALPVLVRNRNASAAWRAIPTAVRIEAQGSVGDCTWSGRLPARAPTGLTACRQLYS